MDKFNCGTCGKETDICYTDDGVLGMVHGFCQCKECYSKTHPLCFNCQELTDKLWKYCAHCGAWLGRR